MLTRLAIQNFALIEHVEIEFGEGLNIITGATGAGKSILLGALNCILGEPTRPELIRTGCEQCVVEGLFEFDENNVGCRSAMNRLRDLHVESIDKQIALRREIRNNGRSRAYVDGNLVPLKRLREIGEVLVDLHGQHEHQSLLNEEHHVRFLDECAQLREQAEIVRISFDEVEQSARKLENLKGDYFQRQHEEELRVFQLEEIRRIAPEEGEDERLENKVRILTNRAELSTEVSHVLDNLYQNDGAIVESISACRRQLDRMAKIDGQLDPLIRDFEELLFRSEDIASNLKKYLDQLEENPEQLEQSQERLLELRKLAQKYGGNLKDVSLAICELESSGAILAKLRKAIVSAEMQHAKAVDRFTHNCVELSVKRNDAATALAKEIETGLDALGISGAKFEFVCTREEDPEGLVEFDGIRYRANATGIEKVAFFISTNPGEPMKPLVRTASGGEISRIMLVLKLIIAEKDSVSTLVFDEIDSGISGSTASAVGHYLEQLGHSHQTIAITHLPQIACLANQHFAVRKSQQKERTITEVHRLDNEDERLDEIASLLAGGTLSTSARQHAAELLK